MEEQENRNISIFRVEAVQRYLQSQQESVLPQFTSPKIFLYIWILITLLIVSLCLTWFVKIPVYASGKAVVVEAADDSFSNSLALTLFLPSQYQDQLQEGQSVLIQSESSDKPIQQTIVAVSPNVIGPMRVTAVYGIAPGVVTEPAAVAQTQFDTPLTSSLPASTYIGSRYTAQVKVGTRSLISLISFNN